MNYALPSDLTQPLWESETSNQRIGDGQRSDVATTGRELSLTERNTAAAQRIYSSITSEQIRIVTIKRGCSDDVVECSLEAVNLTTRPSFEALSYTWGSRIHSGHITLEGVLFSVTENLWDALFRLRSSDRDRKIWIDALAINQADISERNHQVKNMQTVFGRAERVFVWIGELKHYPPTEFFNLLDVAALSGSMRQSVYDTLATGNKEQLSDLGRSLKSIANSDYWFRIWVVQELALAKNAVIMCGHHVVSYERFIQFYDILVRLQIEEAPSVQNTTWVADSWISEIGAIQRRAQIGGPYMLPLPYSLTTRADPDLRFWLQYSARKFCADDRDYVYGFYACFSDSIRDLLTVDYNLRIWEVYRNAAEAFINETSSPRIVCWAKSCMKRATRMGGTESPSWVPDFASMSWDTHFCLLHSSNRFKSITGSLPASPRITTTRSKSFLSTEGVHIGWVTNHFGIPECTPFSNAFAEICWTIQLYSASCGRAANQRVASTIVRYRSLGQWNFQRDRQWHDTEDAMVEFNSAVQSDEIFRDTLSNRTVFTFNLAPDMHKSMQNPEDGHPFIGIGPQDIRIGDKVCVIFGCSAAVVLREIDSFHYIVGDAYIDGFMNGEAVAGIQTKKQQAQTFHIR